MIPWTIQSMEFSRPEYWSGEPFSSPGDFPDLGIKPRSPSLQADSLPAESPGKPKNNGVDSLCLLQRILLTQESNQGLLHCRQILYQLSHQGSLGCIRGRPIILEELFLSPEGNFWGYSQLWAGGIKALVLKWVWAMHTAIYNEVFGEHLAGTLNMPDGVGKHLRDSDHSVASGSNLLSCMGWNEHSKKRSSMQ